MSDLAERTMDDTLPFKGGGGKLVRFPPAEIEAVLPMWPATCILMEAVASACGKDANLTVRSKA